MTSTPNATAILFVGVGQSRLPHPGKLRAMLPLVDKPALQIAVESLVRLGCKVLHVFLEDSPAAVRDFLGNGERWGLQLTYHYLDEELSLAGNFRRLTLDPAQACWLGCAERLPQEFINPAGTQTFAAETAFFHGPQDEAQWTGWGHFSAAFLQTLDTAPVWEDLANSLRTDNHLTRQWLEQPYDLTREPQYLESTLRYLARLTQGSMDQMVIARSARIHPTAQITGPAYIGPHARIEADAVIGPNAVIGHDSVIDQTAEIINTVVLPETYVGHGLFLEEAVVAPGTLASIKNQTVIQDIEPHLLAASRRGQPAGSKRNAIAAILLRVGLLPLYALARIHCRAIARTGVQQLRIFRAGAGAQSNETITLPIAGTSRHSPALGNGSWSAHFLNTFYPGLAAVAAGQIDLFGLELRDAEEIAKLPADWQALYHAHPAGLLNEIMSDGATVADANLRFAADACAAAGLPTRTKLRILGSYLINVLCDASGLCRTPHLAQP